MKWDLPTDAADVLRLWLLAEMAAISEEGHCAGWLMDLERAIWDMIERYPIPEAGIDFGMMTIPKARLERIKLVRDVLGQWPLDYDEFVSVDEFRKRHDALAGVYVTLYAINMNNGTSEAVQ